MIFAEGQALLENQSAPPEIKIIKINSGLKILIRGTPADLIAVSSFLSERFPNAIILATRIAIGRARFTILAKFEVLELDRVEYKEMLEKLSEEELALLNSGKNFYEITFRNHGGLVMPLIIQFEYEDGEKEIRKIPA